MERLLSIRDSRDHDGRALQFLSKLRTGLLISAILGAEGDKQARILKAEGVKQSMVLEAEGRQESAERDAEARERLARAEACAVTDVSNAIQAGSGKAVNYFVAKNMWKPLVNSRMRPIKKTPHDAHGN